MVGAPVLELCEPRLLLAAFVVTSAADSGAGTLRQAILDANATGSNDTISFNIGGGGAQTISVLSNLPAIAAGAGSVVLDATTQPGYAGSPLVTLNGNLGLGNGLILFAGNSTIKGLAIQNFGSRGIFVGSNGNNVIEGNHLLNNGMASSALGDGIVLSAVGSNLILNNVISDNSYEGIQITGGSSNNTITGNRIGTNIAGTAALGNSTRGISIDAGGSTGNLITNNLISGNGEAGISIGSNSNTVKGNLIGTNASGTAGVANGGHGIEISASNNLIGGTLPGEANTIAFNNGIGVTVITGTGNRITGNSIHSNVRLGIDLTPTTTGVTPNDLLDLDGGPNSTQNYPILVTAASNGTSTVVTGTFNSTANSTFTIEFFSSPTLDPSGFGEGRVYLGSTTVTTDLLSNAVISATVAAVPLGHFITATATSAGGNTSEFSGGAAVISLNVAPTVTVDNAGVAVSEGATAANSGTFSDANAGDNVTFTASEGTVTKSGTNSGAWLWSKNTTDDEPPHTVTITANDGNGGTASVTFTLTVNNANPTVTAANASVTVSEGVGATNSGTFGDVAADVVTITASEGTVSQSGGIWTWSKPTTDDEATHPVTITATDDDGGVSTVTFNLTVNNANPSVTANNPSVTVTEGSTATNSGTFADVAADTVTITASQGTVTQGAGTWSWSQATTDDASDTVTITATDEDGGSSAVTFTLTVSNANPSVTANSASVTVSEGTAATNSGTFADVAADTVIITASEGTVTQSAGAWSWSKATTDDEATHTVTITATDDNGGVSTTTFTLTVNNVNPVVAVGSGSVSVAAGATATNSGTFSDLGLGDIVTITASEGTISQTSGASGTWNWSKATTAAEATHTVTITATDDNGGTATITFDLTVTPVVSAVGATVTTDPANPGDTMLLVTSNAIGHRIDIDPGTGGSLVVTIRNGSSTVFQQSFAGSLDRIVVEGGDGDDVIRVNSGVNVPVELYGGAGNDWLRGGSDNDYLDGGEGNDLLFGHDGRDILVGGDGFDIVTGNQDEDILIGGVYTGTRAALAALLAEWGSANSYTVRVNNLRNGGGLNGSFVLNATTVFDDVDMDVLLGLQGRDWFLADGEDDVTDDHANEVLTDIEIDFINS